MKEVGKGYWEEGPASTRAQDDYGIVLVEIKAETEEDWRMGSKGPEHWSMCVVSALKPRWPQGDSSALPFCKEILDFQHKEVRDPEIWG